MFFVETFGSIILFCSRYYVPEGKLHSRRIVRVEVHIYLEDVLLTLSQGLAKENSMFAILLCLLLFV